MSDHDLLITMHEQIKGIKGDIKDLKDGTSTKLTDHENRIRGLETSITAIKTYGAAGLILIGIAEFLITKFIR